MSDWSVQVDFAHAGGGAEQNAVALAVHARIKGGVKGFQGLDVGDIGPDREGYRSATSVVLSLRMRLMMR